MSLATHFEALSVYESAAVRIVRTDGETEDLMSGGGGLQARFDTLGRGPLVSVLQDPVVRSVLLGDGELEVELARDGTSGTLAVRFGGAPVLQQAVEIPAPRASWPGPWVRPTEWVEDLDAVLADHDVPVLAVRDLDGGVHGCTTATHGPGLGQRPLVGMVPTGGPNALGSAAFRASFGLDMAYVAGAMAGGIASPDLVVAMADAGLLAFYGSGGLPMPAVIEGIDSIRSRTKGAWGANLLHNPAEPAMEEETVDLYLDRGVTLVSASAFMNLTRAIVRYRLTGIHRAADGTIVVPNQVFAKISRVETATRFLQPAPASIVEGLVADGVLTAEQAELAKSIPMAAALTAEGDSGGHTDHRTLIVLLPRILALRDQWADSTTHPVYVGAAGGLGTPQSIWAAFALGADYVLTGSINQATPEAGTSDAVKAMLADAADTDVASGPAPDMFEMGAKVQVLSRGSMYAQRSAKLYELYKAYPSMDEIPAKERAKLEKQLFKRPLSDVWEGTREYWATRDPRQVEKAEREPRHQMALTFRWYLGMTSRWARMGDADRKRDYQIWCGPAMGAFNAWAADGPLQDIENRGVVAVAHALMNGAATERRRSMASGWGLR